MNTSKNGYATDIDYSDNFTEMPSTEECRLILQYMPELYADMMRLIKEDEI